MPVPGPRYETLDDWIAGESCAFSPDSRESIDAAVDRVMGSLDSSVELLGFGEAMHGWQEILVLRNRVFEKLVRAHGFSAMAVESSFPRGRVADEYVQGRGPATFEAVQDAGFSHGFGKTDANRELVEWMRAYNADPSHGVKLRFYGFDAPTEMTHADSPRQLLHFVLDYLASVESAGVEKRRARIDELLGDDAGWENPAASFDPAKAVGLSPAATALRIETEDLINELRLRRPDFVARSDAERYSEAEQYASLARQMLNYHATLAQSSDSRITDLLGIRDVIMADNLNYIVSRERGRGKVLAFAHNSHLKCGKAEWQLGPHALAWWPAGAHAREVLGPRYAVIASGVGACSANGIGQPEAGTLEARLVVVDGPARFVPTARARRLPPAAIKEVPMRSGSVTNPSYFPLSGRSLEEFDALVVLD